MKTIRNSIFGSVLMYKTSLVLNPITTSIATAVVVAFGYSIAKIFGF